MSNLTTTYAYFSSIDFKGENVLSSYALSGTPLLFVPEIPEGSNNKVIWNFGDGTQSRSLCASKFYSYPGQYTVNLIVYDCRNNSQLSNFSQNLTIKPYNLDFLSNTLTSYNLSSLGLFTGKLKEFKTSQFFPPFQPISNIYFSVSGSNSSNYFSISSNKFSHLQSFYSFYEKEFNYYLQEDQYSPIDKIVLNTNPIFGKINNGEIIITDENDSTFFLGTSGEKTFYFKDDQPSDLILLDFYQDKNNQIDPNTGKKVDYFNLLNTTLSSNILANDNITNITITSNGMDGEVTPISSFDINQYKFTKTKIPFVIKVKDGEHHTVKNVGGLDLSSFNFEVLSANFLTDSDGDLLVTNDYEIITTEFNNVNSSFYSISSLNYTLSSIDHEGSFRGYLIFNDDIYLESVTLSATPKEFTIFNGNYFFNLSGKSSNFTLYPKNYFNSFKRNENIDFSKIIKDLRFQDILLDKDILFDDFIESIFGNLSSTHDTLGKTIYEKINNFFQNHQDVDRSEINSLISKLQLMDSQYNYYDNNYLKSPSNIKRIMDQASISKNKYLGTTNKFRENFDPRGFVDRSEFGKNLGDQIDVYSYQISAGTDIVALEKFSNRYSLLNTYQPLCALSGNNPYPLSSYNSDWGWPLVLPASFNIDDIEKYYIFFEFNNQIDNTLSEGLIDFTTTLTTIPSSYDNYEILDIFENMMTDTFYDSLSLFES